MIRDVQAYQSLVEQLHRDHPDTNLVNNRLEIDASCSTTQLGLLSRQDLANSELVRAVLESPLLASLVGHLLQVKIPPYLPFRYIVPLGQAGERLPIL
jgi:hypothetical protein